jgi:hypothetical protein
VNYSPIIAEYFLFQGKAQQMFLKFFCLTVAENMLLYAREELNHFLTSLMTVGARTLVFGGQRLALSLQAPKSSRLVNTGLLNLYT